MPPSATRAGADGSTATAIFDWLLRVAAPQGRDVGDEYAGGRRRRGVDPPQPRPVTQGPHGVAGGRGRDVEPGGRGRRRRRAGRQRDLGEGGGAVVAHPQLGEQGAGSAQRRPQPGLLAADGGSPDDVGALQRGPLGALRQPVRRAPGRLRRGAGRSFDQAGGGRGRHRAAGRLPGQPEHAGPEQVGGLGDEDRVGLGLGSTAGWRAGCRRRAAVRRAMPSVRGAALAGADPDVVLGRVVRGPGAAHSTSRQPVASGLAAMLGCVGVGRAPAADGAPPGAAVVGVPDAAAGRRRVGPLAGERLDPDVADPAGDPGGAGGLAAEDRAGPDRLPQVGRRARGRLGHRPPAPAAGRRLGSGSGSRSPRPGSPRAAFHASRPRRSSGRESPARAGQSYAVTTSPVRGQHPDVAVLHLRRLVGQQRGLGRGQDRVVLPRLPGWTAG